MYEHRATLGAARRNLFALACFGAIVILSGCATGVAGSPRRICADAGLQTGPSEFTSCWHRVRDQMFAAEAGPMAVGLAAGLAATKPLPYPATVPAAPTSAPAASVGSTL